MHRQPAHPIPGHRAPEVTMIGWHGTALGCRRGGHGNSKWCRRL